jgi:hypothetical protein
MQPEHVSLANAARFVALAERAKRIADSDTSWETKYELIFATGMPSLSRSIRETGHIPDYYDPDTSYEDDVRAFVDAVTAKADDLRKALA